MHEPYYKIYNEKLKLYWSDKYSWVECEAADVFSHTEAIGLTLPEEGRWYFFSSFPPDHEGPKITTLQVRPELENGLLEGEWPSPFIP